MIQEPYSITRTVGDALKRLARLEKRAIGGPNIQVLPSGEVYFPSGIQTGSAGVSVKDPYIVPPVSALGLSTSAAMDAVTLSAAWNRPMGFGSDQVVSYLVQWKRDTEVIWESTTTHSLEVTLQGVLPGTSYSVAVTALTRTGKPSIAVTDTITTARDETPPAAPTDVLARPAVRGLLVTWAQNLEADMALGRYRVRVHLDAEPSTIVFDSVVSGTVVNAGNLETGIAYQVSVQAIDTSGNTSPWTFTGPVQALKLVNEDLAWEITGVNILKNSGFKDGLAGWNVGPSSLFALVDGTDFVPDFDTQSALLSYQNHPDWPGARVYQSVVLTPGVWSLSAFVKFVSGDPTYAASIEVLASGGITPFLVNGQQKQVMGVSFAPSTEPGGLADWTRKSVFVTVTQEATVGFILRSGTYNSFRFDNAQLAKTSELLPYAPRPDITFGSDFRTVTIHEDVIKAPMIQAGSITAGKIAAGVIGADELAVTTAIKVGQTIRSYGYVPGSTGWAIMGDGSAEFSNVTVRGSTWTEGQIVGGTINIGNALQVPHGTAGPGAIRLAGNVEIGSSFSGTLYSGDSTSSLQFGQTPSDRWTYIGCNMAGRMWTRNGWYDTNPAQPRWLFFVDHDGHVKKEGPLGSFIIEKTNQAGDWGQKCLILEADGAWHPSGNLDQVGIAFNAPVVGSAVQIKFVGSEGAWLQVRTADDAAYGGWKASAFVVNSQAAKKTNVSTLSLAKADKLDALRPITFRRARNVCSACFGKDKSCETCHGKDPRSKATKQTEESGWIGFTAENVAEHFPELVSFTEENGEIVPDGIDYAGLTAVVAAETQELRRRVAELERIAHGTR